MVEIGFDDATAAAAAGQALLEPLHKATVTIEDNDFITWYYLDCNDYYVDEGGTATIVLKRRGDLSVATTTTLTATDLSTVAAMDYGTLTATTDLIFAVGEDEKTVTLAITDDSSQEERERLMVEIGFDDATAAAAAGQALLEPLHKATVTIEDNDFITWYYLDCNDYYVDEGGTVTIVLKRRGDLSVATTTTLTATDLSTVAAMDYGTLTATTDLIFAVGEDEKTVTLAITDDSSQEERERLMVEIGFDDATAAAAAGQALLEPLHKATVTIEDNDFITWYYLDCNDYYVDEGGTVTIVLKRRGDLSVATTTTLTATDLSTVAAMDYGTLTATTDLIFAVGEDEKTVTLAITDDSSQEERERLMVEIGFDDATAAAAAGQALLEPLHKATVTIEDNDFITWYYLDCNDYYVGEGGTVTIVLKRRGDLSVATTTTLTATDLSTVAAMDYGTLTATTDLIFAVGEDEKTVTLAITDDSSQEERERLMVEIGFDDATAAAAAGQALFEPLHKATVTIEDNDFITLYFLDCNDYYVDEATGTIDIIIRRQGDLSVSQIITLTATDRSATSTMDYGALTPATDLTFAATEDTKTVALAITDDKLVEHTEQLIVEIGFDDDAAAATAGQALLEPLHKATVTIEDEDIEYWIDPVYVFDECDAAVEVVVHRNGYLGNTDDEVGIYTTAVSATTADYTDIPMATATVSFNADDTAVAHLLTLTPDDLVEGFEYFMVVIATPGGTNAANALVHTVLDTAKVFILDHSTKIWIDPIYVGAEDNTVSIYVHRSGYLGDDTTVVVTVGAAGDTATVTTDYALNDPTAIPVAFVDGEEVKEVVIDLVEDGDVEGTEYVTVTLGTITMALATKTTLDTARDTATIFILDRSFLFWIDPVYIGDECDTMVEVVVHRCGYLGHTDDAVGISTDTTGAGVTASAADFTEINPAVMVTFAQGECAVAHQLELKPDTLVEGMEYFEVVIATVAGTNMAKGSVHAELFTAKVFILDHSTIIWIDSTYTGEEGSTVKLQVHRSGYVGQDTSVEITLTPQTAVIADYDDIGGATTIDFVDGEIVQELLLDLETDALVEGIEYFQAVLGAVTVADTAKTTVDPMLNTANIFILDLTSYFRIEEKQYIAFEETTLEVTFIRGGYLGRTDVIEVTYTDARATDPEDYAPDMDTTITFNDDETTATKTIVIEPDNILEYNEMFFFEIDIPAGSALLDTARLDSPSVSEVIIKDPTWYVFNCADFTVIESTGQVVITILRKGDLRTEGHVWIGTRDRLTPVELTASSATDFTFVTMQVDFAVGQPVATVTIDITHDVFVEGDEQFQVYLYDPDTAEALGDLHKAIVTIYDDDDSSTYSFRRVVHHVPESGGSVIITILRDGPLASDTAGSVDISTVDSQDSRFLTAENGTDFVGFESKTIEFLAGNRIVHHTINLADGVDVDKQEYFEVCMSNPTFGTIDPPECAIVYIEDDDSVFGFDKPIYYVKEDSDVTVNIVRLGCLKAEGSVVISTNDVTAFAVADYRSITNSILPFDIQQTNHTLNVVTSSPDFRVEGEERFELCLSNPVQGVLGLYGLIRCTTVVIEDCDTEISFGDVSYTVNETVGVVTVKVVRRGYLNNINSVVVVSSDVNAKAGATKDYNEVHHTVVFGKGDDPQETTVCFDININDDDVVEYLETFHLELRDVTNALIGQPSIAEVFIEDNDVTYSLDSTKICGSEADGEVTFTVTRYGNQNEETSIDIFTRDISTSSSEPNQDYLPLLEELSHNVIFAPGETSKTVTIDIVDDTFYELPEEFEVILASDIAAELSAPSSAVVTIISDDIICALDCQNGGFCVGPDECQCADGYTGTLCEEDINECELNPPMCIGNNIECFNKVGTYKCICTDPEYSLEGNRCIRETKTIIGRIYADGLDGLPLQFVREMYDPDSQEFKYLADIVETQLRNKLPPAVDGFDEVSVARLFPTSDGHVGIVFETSVAAASRTDGTDVDILIAACITPDGYLGDSTLRVARPIGQGQYTRSIEGIFYASNGEEFDPSLLDTNSPEFLEFASEVDPALAEIFHDPIFQSVQVKRVVPIGDMICVVYEVTVASTSPLTVGDVDKIFRDATGLSGYLGYTDWRLLSIGDRCPRSFCANGGVCNVQTGFTFSCICDAGVIGDRCQGINGTDNTSNGITTQGWIALGYGVGCSALAAFFVALCCIYWRMGRVGPRNIPFDTEPPIPSYVVRDPYVEVDAGGQLTPAFPSLLNMANTGTGNDAYWMSEAEE
ncbi:uncharacterized protein [Amphiura filiformis]|uniref:uncharacterized protein n=1 Tax=Amphiura filiformis TaxID=82378 RepID=UPI003B22657E